MGRCAGPITLELATCLHTAVRNQERSVKNRGAQDVSNPTRRDQGIVAVVFPKLVYGSPQLQTTIRDSGALPPHVHGTRINDAIRQLNLFSLVCVGELRLVVTTKGRDSSRIISMIASFYSERKVYLSTQSSVTLSPNDYAELALIPDVGTCMSCMRS